MPLKSCILCKEVCPKKNEICTLKDSWISQGAFSKVMRKFLSYQTSKIYLEIAIIKLFLQNNKTIDNAFKLIA